MHRLQHVVGPAAGGHDTGDPWRVAVRRSARRAIDRLHGAGGMNRHSRRRRRGCGDRCWLRQRQGELDQAGWRKMLAGVAPTMSFIILPLATQPQRAELVLVATLAGLEANGLLVLAAGREGRAPDVGRAGPDAAPAGARAARML